MAETQTAPKPVEGGGKAEAGGEKGHSEKGPVARRMDALRASFVDKFGGMLKREEKPLKMLKEMGAEKPRAETPDWKKVTKRAGILRRRELDPHAKEWATQDEQHRADVRANYDMRTNHDDSKLSRREKTVAMADAVYTTMKNAGEEPKEATKEVKDKPPSAKDVKRDMRKSSGFQDALEQELFDRALKKGKPLSKLRLETRRAEADLLFKAVKGEEPVTAEQKAQAAEKTKAEAETQATQAAKAAEQQARESMLQDPKFANIRNNVFKDKGYSPDTAHTLSQSQLTEVQQLAEEKYRETQEQEAIALEQQEKQEAIAREKREKTHPIYGQTLLNLAPKVASGELSMEDARSQALDAARKKIDAEDLVAEAKAASSDTDKAEASSGTPEDKYKKAKADIERAHMEGKITDEQLNDQIAAARKEFEASQSVDATKSAETTSTETAQSAADVLKGLNIDVSTPEGKRVLDAMNAAFEGILAQLTTESGSEATASAESKKSMALALLAQLAIAIIGLTLKGAGAVIEGASGN